MGNNNNNNNNIYIYYKCFSGYPQSTNFDVANPKNAYFRLASSNLCRNWEAESPATDSSGFRQRRTTDSPVGYTV